MIKLKDFLDVCTPRTKVMVFYPEVGEELFDKPITIAEFERWCEYEMDPDYPFEYITRIHYSNIENCLELDVE